jgi:hypothetical protein
MTARGNTGVRRRGSSVQDDAPGGCFRHGDAMAPRWTFAMCALFAGLALAVSACGGDGSSSATTATTATTAAETTASGGSERLDQASWDTYVATRTSAQAVNQKAIKTFRKCKSLVLSSVSQEKVQTCMSTSAADVVTEGRKVQAVLNGFSGQVTGACKDANTELNGMVTLYIATVNGIDTQVKNGNVPSSQTLQSALAQLGRTQAAVAAFEQACKPE